LNLSDATVLVTGGAGLIGSHIVDELVKEKARVVVYDFNLKARMEHLKWAADHGSVELVEGDLRDLEGLSRALRGVDYVFHQAAAWLRACQETPRLSLDVNVIGTFNLLEASVAAGVKKVVGASSSSVYGEGSSLPTEETHPFNNDLFYGASKIANEQHYRAFHKRYGLDFVGLRYLNIYGPRQPFDGPQTDVIMHFLNRIDADLPPAVRGDGSATVDLVYVGDAAKANLRALKSRVTNDFFNVASGRETSVGDLANLLIRLAGKEGHLQPEFEPMDSGLVNRRWGSPEKARHVLGFAATTPLEEGLTRVIEWREQVKRSRAQQGVVDPGAN
jgi:UDP-glucose 4-epimerase